MRNLRNLRSFFSSQEQLSMNQLQTLRGGAMVPNNAPVGQNPVGQNPSGQNPGGQNQNAMVCALDDNKRPERPGGGVSTH